MTGPVINARMRRSAYLLGRRPAREIFKEKGEVVLSAVDCRSSQGPWRMFVEAPSECRPGPTVLYRVRVKRKTQ